MPTIDLAARFLAAPLTARRGEALSPHPVVILGAKTTPETGLSLVLEERMRAGIELFVRGRADLVCITGTATESEAMVAHALGRGVPQSALLVDSAAKNTYDNAANVAVLLRTRGRDTAWVATQPFHSRRACFWFRHFGVTPLPWHLPDSLQYTDSRRAIRWIAREYVSWGVLAGRFFLPSSSDRRRREHQP